MRMVVALCFKLSQDALIQDLTEFDRVGKQVTLIGLPGGIGGGLCSSLVSGKFRHHPVDDSGESDVEWCEAG